MTVETEPPSAASEKRFHVYVITHTESGRHYVGKTAQNPPIKRWKGHIKDVRRGNKYLFINALRKYGPEAFTFQVIESFETESDAVDAEEWWIGYLRTTVRDYGFNVCKRGTCRAGFKHTPEARELIRAASASRKHSPETIVKMKHRHFSPEHRRRISQAISGKVLPPETRTKVSYAVRRLWSDTDYRKAMSEAHSSLTGEDVMNIRSRCSRGEKQSAVGIDFGITQRTVSKIVTGKTWKHLPLVGKGRK